MDDIASLVLGDFQETIVDAFGSSLGWFIGHSIVLFLTLSIFWAIKNRHHILNESGWGRNNLKDISVIILLTFIQYIIFTNTLNFPEGASIGIAFLSTMTLRWHILVLE